MKTLLVMLVLLIMVTVSCSCGKDPCEKLQEDYVLMGRMWGRDREWAIAREKTEEFDRVDRIRDGRIDGHDLESLGDEIEAKGCKGFEGFPKIKNRNYNFNRN